MEIKLINPFSRSGAKMFENSILDDEGVAFERKNGVYKITGGNNYTESFGFQWNKFAKTQIDRFHSHVNQSSERFFKEAGWSSEELKGKNVLEVGSGAGRFTKVVLDETEANLFSVDYSSAVNANFSNNGDNSRLKLFQASIYEMPFAPHQFDYVMCLGVLQHTPDFRKSIESLASMVKVGGKLSIDFYEKRGFYTKIHAKYLIRSFTKKLNPNSLLGWIERNVDWMIGLYNKFNSFGFHFLTRFIPICDIKNTLPKNLTREQLREWVILDTFDMLSPAYDNPQKITTVVNWIKNTGLEVTFSGHIALESGKAAVVRAQRMF